MIVNQEICTMPRISLIVPVYNAASYIEDCLASLVAQTLDDIEVLLVDDHGRDDSMQMAKAYVEAHPCKKRFRYLETPHNMGPGPARNVGIENALGEYIGFVDRDDVVAVDFCERLYSAARQYDADLAYCQAELVKPNEVTPLRNPVIESGAFEGERRRYFLTHYATLFVSFLYRTSLLREYGINFPATRSAEESLSEVRNPKRYIDKIKSFDLLMEFAKERGLYDANREELDYIYLKKGYLLGILTYIYNEEHPQMLTVCKIHNHLLSYVPDYKANPYYHADRKLRLLHTLIRQGLRLAFKVLPWYIRKTKMKL